MTHSLHREGEMASLKRDFVVLSLPARGFNDVGADEKLEHHVRIVLKHGPDNMGCNAIGHIQMMDPEEFLKSVPGHANTYNAVVTDRRALIDILKELKRAQLGMSVVVSGLREEVLACCREAGLRPHTVNYSLGVWGRTELLPSREVRELSTMCGHGMISFGLAEEMISAVRGRRLSAGEAARVLAGPCVCGLFNVSRAREILEKAASSK